MRDDGRIKLLFGPYQAPPLKRGDRTHCLFRDRDVVVTSWTDARIPWPRCRALDTHGGGSGLLVTEELVRAVRAESAAALKFWFGVSTHTVWSWRKAFGVAQWGTEGSRRLHRQLSEAGADVTRGQAQDSQVVAQRIRTRRARGVKPPDRWKEGGWNPQELALLGTLPDEEVVRKTGRSANAVRLKRERIGILGPEDGRLWTAEEAALLGKLADREVAKRTGRTPGAVTQKRIALGIANRFDGRRHRTNRGTPS